MQQVEVHHTKIEEQEGDDEGGNTSESNNFKGYITLCTEDFFLSTAFTFHLTCSQTNRTLDDTPRLDDTNDT